MKEERGRDVQGKRKGIEKKGDTAKTKDSLRVCQLVWSFVVVIYGFDQQWLGREGKGRLQRGGVDETGD